MKLSQFKKSLGLPILILVCFFVSFPLMAEEDEKEEAAKPHAHITPAVTDKSEKTGIQLSEKAMKTLALKRQEVQGSSPFNVPSTALVFHQDEVGIYRFRKGWFKLIDITLVNKTASQAVIRTDELTSGDQIVTQGVPLLRIADLNAWGGAGEVD